MNTPEWAERSSKLKEIPGNSELMSGFQNHPEAKVESERAVFRPSRYAFVYDLNDGDGSILLYNSLTQALFRFPGHPLKQVVRAVLAGRELPSRLPENLRETLTQEGFLVPREIDELRDFREKIKSYRRSTATFSLAIAPTLNCIFRCPYCYVRRRPVRMDRRLVESLKVFVAGEIIPKISSLTIFWYGGEPLLAKDLVLELQAFFQERCRERGVAFRSGLLTNGYLLTPELAAQMVENGTELVSITLDGPPEIHDLRRVLAGGRPTFAHIYENLKSVIDIFPVIDLRVNLDQDNWQDFPALLDLLECDGLLSRVFVSPGSVRTHHEHNRDYAQRCFKRWEALRITIEAGEALVARMAPYHSTFERRGLARCGALRQAWLGVDPEGLVYKCYEDLGEAQRAVGRLEEGKLYYYDRYLRWQNFDPTAPAECQECRYLPVCVAKRCFNADINQENQAWECSGIKDYLEPYVKLHYQCRTGFPNSS